MKKLIAYIAIAAVMLSLVFALNELYIRENDAFRDSQPDNTQQSDNVESGSSSYIPVVEINTNGQRISKDEEILVQIKISEQEDDQSEILRRTLAAAITYRGNSSYYTFDKKQYRIEFRKDKDPEQNSEHSIAGMPAASDWVLNGPFLDRSLSRNYLGYKVSRELLPWAPDTEYCEVYLDGEYQGLYIIIEPVTNDIGRLGMSDYSLVSGRCSYIAKFDRIGEEENSLQTFGMTSGYTSNEISISYPTVGNLTSPQKEYIANDINEFEKALYSDNFADEETGYAKYIDVSSFVDYFIISEMMLITDAGYLSTYFYKDMAPNSKIKMTTWDFNNSYDNIPWEEKSNEAFYLVDTNWFSRLVQDRSFVQKVVARYRELRRSTLSDEYLLNAIDENVAFLGDSIDRNFEVWGYTFHENMLSNHRDPESFEEAISMLEDAIVQRGDFLDNNIDKLFDYCIN